MIHADRTNGNLNNHCLGRLHITMRLYNLSRVWHVLSVFQPGVSVSPAVKHTRTDWFIKITHWLSICSGVTNPVLSGPGWIAALHRVLLISFSQLCFTHRGMCQIYLTGVP